MSINAIEPHDDHGLLSKKKCLTEALLGKQNMFGYFYSTCFYRVKHNNANAYLQICELTHAFK